MLMSQLVIHIFWTQDILYLQYCVCLSDCMGMLCLVGCLGNSITNTLMHLSHLRYAHRRTAGLHLNLEGQRRCLDLLWFGSGSGWH